MRICKLCGKVTRDTSLCNECAVRIYLEANLNGESIQALCKKHGIPRRTFNYRIKRLREEGKLKELVTLELLNDLVNGATLKELEELSLILFRIAWSKMRDNNYRYKIRKVQNGFSLAQVRKDGEG
jgi:transposase-like protein